MVGQLFLGMPARCHGNNFRVDSPCTLDVEWGIANDPNIVNVHFPAEMGFHLDNGGSGHIVPFVMLISKPTTDKIVP